MALRTSVQAGKWSAAATWDTGVPINGDSVSIGHAVECDSDESAKILSGGNSSITAGGTLTIRTTGKVYAQDRNFTIDSGATLAFDGGTFRLIRTATNCTLTVTGDITGTANGGELEFSANASWVFFEIRGSVVGSATKRLHIDCGIATSSVQVNNTNGRYPLVENCDIEGGSSMFNTYGARIRNCTIHGFSYALNGAQMPTHIADSWVYGNTYGVYTNTLPMTIFMQNTAFGEREDGTPDANTTADFHWNTLRYANIVAHGCRFSSPTLLSNPTNATPLDFVATAVDADPADWFQYQGMAHLAQPEFGAGAQGGSGAAVKCVSSAQCADDEASRFRRLVAVLPADHGDKIDATLYLRGTAGKTAVLRIDPDGLFGTTQAYNETADGNWNQRTIPQYTVAAGVGKKVAVPIYLDITGASETWYYDTLDWTIT